MLSIRLRRTGSTKRPYYRVVVTDSRSRRDGRFVEILGHYDPRRDPVGVEINTERAQHWISKGARPSATVRSLMEKLPSGTEAEPAAEASEAPEPASAPEAAEAAKADEAEA